MFYIVLNASYLTMILNSFERQSIVCNSQTNKPLLLLTTNSMFS